MELVGQRLSLLTQARVVLAIWFLVCAGSPCRGGCNGNGIDDRLEVETGQSEDCNENGVPDECDVAGLSLVVRQSHLRVAKIAVAGKAADIDGDGDLDLITGSQDTSVLAYVSVLFNEGDQQFLPAVDYPVGMRLRDLDVADVDQDGAPDLVVANVSAVSVLRNDGAGTFETLRSYAAEDGAEFVVAADLTGDGYPELVTGASGSSSVVILANSTTGEFGLPRSVPTGNRPSAVCAVDFDRDGDVDLAVPSKDAGSVSVLLNQGEGTFALPLAYSDVGDALFEILADDLDGDGDYDLATAGRAGVSVLLNDGSGVFGDEIFFALSVPPNSLTSGDLEGDGDRDLVVGYTGRFGITLLRNAGGGGFRVAVQQVNYGVSHRSGAVVAQDLDGDGDVDPALVFTHAVRILWNIVTDALVLGALEFSVGGPPHTIAIGDVNGNGHLDVVTGNNRRSNAISVLPNRGDGLFTERTVYNGAGTPTSIQLADIDGDGDLDLGALGGGFELFLNDGDGSYESFSMPTGAYGSATLTAAELTGDGYPDLVVTNGGRDSLTILENDPDQTFSIHRELVVGSRPFNAAAADFDLDGDLDLGVSNTGSFDISVLMNLGDGTFADETRYQTTNQPAYLAAADLDADGQVDLAVANAASVSIFWGTGNGVFDAPENVATTVRPHSLIAADIEGDRSLEVVTANPSVGSVSVLYHSAAREFDPVIPYSVGAVSRFVVAGDVDGDGDVDLVAADRGSQTITVLSNPSSSGARFYREQICLESDFVAVSVPGSGDLERVAKFTVPARADQELLPPLFQDAHRFSLHQEFLAAAFPERFGALDADAYSRLVARRASRDYFVGTIRRQSADVGFRYAFDVVADTGFDAREVLTLEEIGRVHEVLGSVFLLGPLGYRPRTRAAIEKAKTWMNPPFPVFFDGAELAYEAYAQGTGYGHLRLLTLEQFEAANRGGRFTFQDILVVDQTPRNIDGVVGGVITGDTQLPLGNVAIRTTHRGTPNAFVADAFRVLAPLDGQVVRLEVFPTEYFVTPVAVEEAEAFWNESRPQLSEPPGLDVGYRELDRLVDLDLSPANGFSPVARFGGKATNLARLQNLLTGELASYREEGFGIPLHYYVEFMYSNTVIIDGVERTYQEHLEALLALSQIGTDSEARFRALEDFRNLVRSEGVVDRELISRLGERIEEVFGLRTRMVRFRSSSNVESTLEWSGAGLYESTSVCLADTLDDDEDGPSFCDVERENERTIERALKKVWASLWTFRAHEERTFFQIPPEAAAMAILVTRAFLDEAANGIAYTGNPRNLKDRRYVVTAQAGEGSVVSPGPGVTVERNLLEVTGGEVVDIIRERSSSLVEPGEVILSDAHLEELGAFLWRIDEEFPLELAGFRREQVLLECEFKLEPDGALALKQMRPFLLAEAPLPTPTFELEIPPDTITCGVFADAHSGRAPRDELEAKSMVRWSVGTLELSTARDTFPAELFDAVFFGPQREVATAREAGLFHVVRIPGSDNRTIYRFNYEQQFALASGESFAVQLFGLNFAARGETALDERLVLDEPYLTEEFSMQGSLDGNPVVTYSSCRYELLPRWEIEVEFGENSRVALGERFRPTVNFLSTGPASLVEAEVVLGSNRQMVADYWRLVYAAHRHNLEVRYWVLLEPALTMPGVDGPVHVLEVAAPEPPTRPQAQVSFLGESFELLGTAPVRSYRKSETAAPGARFRRGDGGGDGTVSLVDVVLILEYVLKKGAPPSCQSAADANDDGRINVVDAIAILSNLFRDQGPLPEPVGCGEDPTADVLSCDHPPVGCRTATE